MQQPPVKPYHVITIIILAIVLAIGVFLTVMYLQSRPVDDAVIITVEGQDVVIEPVPDGEVFIVPPAEPPQVEATGGEPEAQPVPTEVPPPPAPTETPIPPTAVLDQYIFTNHVIASTDTLYSISRMYITSIALMARFGISSSEIIVGNTIAVPVANPAYCPGYRPIVVIEGDTPLGISLSAGITLEQFGQINNMGGNYAVYETQVVCVP